jgi:Astacin (Peptidase family M12A)
LLSDIILTPKQKKELFSKDSIKRSGMKAAINQWPSGIVPYEFDPSYDRSAIPKIMEAMKYITDRSCVRFVPRAPNIQDYVFIKAGSGCSSGVGVTVGVGKHALNLHPQRCKLMYIVHELLHTLGFLHMQTAP